MAATSVTTDLTTVAFADINNTDGGGAETWEQSGDTTFDNGGSPSDEPDFYIQGTTCVSANHTKSGVNTNTLLFDAGATQTLPTDGAYLIWCFWASPPSLNTYDAATPGLMTAVGTSTTNTDYYVASGSNFEPNPLGGWFCYAVDPSSHTATTTTGSGGGGGDGQVLGMAVTGAQQARGQSFAVDAIRTGRCSSVVTGGTDANPDATFTDISDTLDTSTNRYGIFQAVPGGFSWQGRLALGDGTNEVQFNDSNKNITIINTPKVSAGFHLIEVQNGTANNSLVQWENITFINAGINDPVSNTASRGDFLMTDSANVIFTGCSFTDMGTFDFNAATQQNLCTDVTFRRCETVTQTGATFTNCSFENTISAIQLVSNTTTADSISGCTFVGDGTSHAVDIGNVTANSQIVWNSTFNSAGYSGTNVNNTATTPGDSEVLLCNVSTGVTLTVSVEDGVAAPSYRNQGPGTVSVQTLVNFDITNIRTGTEIRLYKQTAPAALGLGGIEDVSNSGTYDSGFSQIGGPGVNSDTNYSVRYQYNYADFGTDTPIWVIVQALNFQYLRLGFTLTNTNGSLQINQVTDRNYTNPD